MKKTLKRINKKSELLYCHKGHDCHPGIPAETVFDQTGNLKNGTGRMVPVFLLQIFPAIIDHTFYRVAYFPFVDYHIHDCILS